MSPRSSYCLAAVRKFSFSLFYVFFFSLNLKPLHPALTNSPLRGDVTLKERIRQLVQFFQGCNKYSTTDDLARHSYDWLKKKI